MNSCPTCGTQYTDQTLSYCLQDGTPLTKAGAADTPTVLILETETKDRISGNDSFLTQFRSGRAEHNARERQQTGVSSTAKTVGIIAAVVMFAAIGIGGYLLGSRGSSTNTANSGGQTAQNLSNNSNGIKTSITNSLSVTNTAVVPVTPTPFDDTQAKSELAERVASWKSSLESGESDSIVNNYTPVIENYYGNKRRKSSELKKAKAVKLRDYSEIRVDVTGQVIKVDPTGKTATILFDRELWFNGNNPVHNKTRVEMKCRLVDGHWLIYSERDIKTYPAK